jgi:heme-degrading monooxygenase HmoA
MTHSILTIPVRAGEEDAFLAAFARLDVFGHAAQIPGFRGGELLRPLEDGQDFVVHARWESPEGYQAWLDAPVRAQLNGAIGAYVDGPMSGRLYTGFPE